MKKRAIVILITAGTLLLTGCGSSAPTAKEGVATADQMGSIDKVARAIAAEKYSDAASAGYFTLDNHGATTQDAGEMAASRKKHEDRWNQIKLDFDKGCTLVADNINSSGVIESNVVCKGEDKPAYYVSSQFLMGKIGYSDAYQR